MDKSENYRILFIVQELMLGGAGYLAIKWIRKLIGQYDIDILILGPYENKMLAELPESVSVYTLERSLFKSALYRLGSGSPLGAVPFFMERGEILPLKKTTGQSWEPPFLEIGGLASPSHLPRHPRK